MTVAAGWFEGHGYYNPRHGPNSAAEFVPSSKVNRKTSEIGGRRAPQPREYEHAANLSQAFDLHDRMLGVGVAPKKTTMRIF